MKTLRRVVVVLMAIIAALSAVAGAPANDRMPPVYTVNGPMLIAFFPLSRKEAAATENSALEDFEEYLSRTSEPLKARGIVMERTIAESFSVRMGATVTTYHPKNRMCGYYLGIT